MLANQEFERRPRARRSPRWGRLLNNAGVERCDRAEAELRPGIRTTGAVHPQLADMEGVGRAPHIRRVAEQRHIAPGVAARADGDTRLCIGAAQPTVNLKVVELPVAAGVEGRWPAVV